MDNLSPLKSIMVFVLLVIVAAGFLLVSDITRGDKAGGEVFQSKASRHNLIGVVLNPEGQAPVNLYLAKCPVARAFDFPVGPPNAKGYYNAQPFGKNNHVGEDWNGRKGGNSDLGDPIYSIADGIVVFADDIGGGWGNVVRICHNVGTRAKPVYIESVYGHLKDMAAKKGKIVKKGQKIGTMGNLDELYYAHLHLEIRSNIGRSIGGGYSKDKTGFLNPTVFIKTHRKMK